MKVSYGQKIRFQKFLDRTKCFFIGHKWAPQPCERCGSTGPGRLQRFFEYVVFIAGVTVVLASVLLFLVFVAALLRVLLPLGGV